MFKSPGGFPLFLPPEKSLPVPETSLPVPESSLKVAETFPLVPETSLPAAETSLPVPQTSLNAAVTSPLAGESSLAALETSPAGPDPIPNGWHTLISMFARENNFTLFVALFPACSLLALLAQGGFPNPYARAFSPFLHSLFPLPPRRGWRVFAG